MYIFIVESIKICLSWFSICCHGEIGLMDGIFEGLKNEGVDFVIYNKTSQNPTIDDVEEALEILSSIYEMIQD